LPPDPRDDLCVALRTKSAGLKRHGFETRDL
jgi:hypothetical protein